MCNNSEVSADEAPEIGYCSTCEGDFEIVSDDNGTYLLCNCLRDSEEELYEPLDFNE